MTGEILFHNVKTVCLHLFDLILTFLYLAYKEERFQNIHTLIHIATYIGRITDTYQDG